MECIECPKKAATKLDTGTLYQQRAHHKVDIALDVRLIHFECDPHTAQHGFLLLSELALCQQLPLPPQPPVAVECEAAHAMY